MSESTGIHAQLRRTHEARVLAALGERGAMSRAQIAQQVGLSRTTTSEIAADLLARGAIVVAATDADTRLGSGRPAEYLALDPAAGQFVGVDFGHQRVHVAIADASHAIVASGTATYSAETPWPERIAAAIDLIEREARRTGTHLDAIQGVGIGVPGPYPPPRSPGSQAFAPRVPPGVEDAFLERFGVSVLVKNNTRFAGLAEAILAGAENVRDLLYLRIGDGVGGAVIVDGHLVSGSAGLAGEFGHVSVAPDGAVCRCGKTGCLETVASLPAILESCRAAGANVASIDDLAAAVESGNPAVDRVLRSVGTTIGRVLAGVAMVVNPSEVVVAGQAGRVAPAIIEAVAQTLKFELSPIAETVPNVRGAHLGDVGGAHGAIAALYRTDLLPAAGSQPVHRSVHPRMGA
ncbi:ROK family transcriptional regulator [Actinotalea sp. M2MS4P-6]|uniref:ROK family transcriptional regulator n=1 Tax=Actinotalea sp. M2MS4P-6 TaxID=2983762 RepID=UPI0021E44F08|nr:ROK family transcriptional regulator [Actinotalea sp. M2MS4P-6]MCV2396273.1 ROK family transcriptional regulator [Actinotalea sp. M2MS4P-6]